MLLQNKQIAIVGGGPGGLTLARLLQLKGANVNVYERDANQEARVQGSLLDLHDESGLAAIIKAALLEAFKCNFLQGADKTLIVDKQADIFFSDHEGKSEEDFGHKDFRPEIERGALRKILLASLKPDTVVWDSHFLSMDRQNDGWMLHFKNQDSVYADLVIAADGANSKIRPYLTDIKPFYSGITMLEISIYEAAKVAPTICSFLNGGKVMAFGNSKCLLGGQKGNGEMGFYASFRAEQDWVSTSGLDFRNKTQVLSWFRREFSEWSSRWNELFENATMPFIPRPIYCMPLDQTWETLPNLTMIGDAAHVMPPFAGEGANMAMLDALELSECLTSTKYNTLQDAIAEYEIKMRNYASLAAKESLENGERMHAEDSLSSMLSFFQFTKEEIQH